MRDRKGEEWREKLNGNHLRLIPGLCLENNKLIELKVAAGDVFSIRG